MLSNRQHFSKLDTGIKKAKKNLFNGVTMATIRLNNVLKEESASCDWFNAYFKSAERKNWLDVYCHIKIQGNGQRRELILTKDSGIISKIDQYHVLGDLDATLGSAIAYIAPEFIAITASVSTPCISPPVVLSLSQTISADLMPSLINDEDSDYEELRRHEQVQRPVIPAVITPSDHQPLTVVKKAKLYGERKSWAKSSTKYVEILYNFICNFFKRNLFEIQFFCIILQNKK